MSKILKAYVVLAEEEPTRGNESYWNFNNSMSGFNFTTEVLRTEHDEIDRITSARIQLYASEFLKVKGKMTIILDEDNKLFAVGSIIYNEFWIINERKAVTLDDLKERGYKVIDG